VSDIVVALVAIFVLVGGLVTGYWVGWNDGAKRGFTVGWHEAMTEVRRIVARTKGTA
jgi:hypothetical protein